MLPSVNEKDQSISMQLSTEFLMSTVYPEIVTVGEEDKAGTRDVKVGVP